MVERIGDRTAHVVRQVIERDHHQDQQGEGPLRLEEGDERAGDGVEQAARSPQRSLGLLGVQDRVSLDRLLGEERRPHPDRHYQTEEAVGHRPADRGGQEQDQGLGAEQSRPIPEGIGGGQQAEFVRVVGDLDAPGVDHNVLGGGAEGGQAGQPEEPHPRLRADQGHADEAGADADLGQDHPAPPSPQPAGDRR